MTLVALEALTFGLGRLVAAAAAAGERLVLFTGGREVYRYEFEHLDPAAYDTLTVVDLDTHDLEKTAAALADVDDLHGLIGSTDTWAVPGAELAARFGLPGPDPAAARALRDKHRVRELLRAAGLGSDRTVAVPDDPAAARAAVLERVGLPAVLKDTSGTSSRSVWPVRDEAELTAGLAAAAAGRGALLGALFAEPFLAGPLYSAETLTWAGETRLLAVSSRHLSPLPAVREEASALPVALPAAEEAELAEWVGRVLAAAGHDRGFAHVEFAATLDGPQLVEINARIGGALVAEALCRRLGVNVYAAMVDVALGRRPALLDLAPGPGPGPAVGFALVYADRRGTLTGWTGLDALPRYPGAPQWFPTRYPGDAVEHLTDQRGCTGIVLAEGATAELAFHRASTAAGAVRPVLDGPVADGPG